MQDIIDNLKAQIKQAEKLLQYADGRQCGRDKERISEMKEELRQLEIKQFRLEEAEMGNI